MARYTSVRAGSTGSPTSATRDPRMAEQRRQRRKAADNFPYELALAYLRERRHTITDAEFDRLSGLIRARRYDLLSDVDDVSDAHSTASRVTTLRQLRAFFSKNAQFANARTCEQKAMTVFHDGELKCRITNRRLSFYEQYPERLPLRQRYMYSLFRKKLQEILGEVSDFLDTIPSGVRLTSGATEATIRTKSVPFMKLKGYARLPGRSAPFLEALFGVAGLPVPRVFPVDYNRVAFAPKSWKTYRTIACEPAALLPFQLAFDAYIKRRLRVVFGIDLRSQERNTSAALLGSISDDIATIDIKDASGTMALSLVRNNVGAGWWDVLRRLRVADFRMDASSGSTSGTYSKFSSMGNGVTFGLETAIFAAACYAAGVDRPIVYGDDIVVPSRSAFTVIDLLRFLGFRTNVAKTYVSGPFRESCGGDFWSGVDVTPVYLRESVLDRSTRHLIWNGMISRCAPQGPVEEFLTRSFKVLPVIFVPFTGDETEGVWITPVDAWDRKILRVDRARPKEPYFQTGTYKSLTRRSVSVSACRSSRALEMWFVKVTKEGRQRVSDVVYVGESNWEPVESSHYSSTHVVTSVARRHWNPPVAAVPSHLYTWGESLLRLAK